MYETYQYSMNVQTTIQWCKIYKILNTFIFFLINRIQYPLDKFN